MTKILYLGDRPLGMKCLKYLIHEGHDVCAVISRFDKKHFWWGDSVFEEYCKHNYLSWFPYSANILSIIDQYKPDLMMSVLYPKIISEVVLNKLRAYNLHCSPLPEYRGSNSTLWAILNGEKMFGATLHEMSVKVDQGNIIKKGKFEVPSNITNLDLYNMVHENAYRIFCDNIIHIIDNRYFVYPQQVTKGKFYFKKNIPLRVVKLDDDPETISRFARAFYFPPFEPAYIIINNVKIYLIPYADKKGVKVELSSLERTLRERQHEEKEKIYEMIFLFV
tara:strand:- start:510 stop:1343 length:834 start_codon:yes stop_codon:yes gene_type:complete